MEEFEENTLKESNICHGDQVQLIDERIGTIQFIGEISYGDPSKGKNRSGIYYGIELKTKTGQHNGSIRGRKYFKCAPRHGICVQLKEIECITKKSKNTSSRYAIHQLIYIKNKEQVGTIQYIGLCTHLDTDYNRGGLWFGIEIMPEYSRGKYKTTGVIQDIVYFQSSHDCNALFVQESNISTVPRHILAKIHAAKTPKIVLDKNKKGKKVKEERRSSVFDILKNKISDAFGGKPEEKKTSSKHQKSSSIIDTKSIETRTRSSRSHSTPKTPQKELADANPMHVATADRNNRQAIYRTGARHKEKENKIKLNKHHKIKKRGHNKNDRLALKASHSSMEHKHRNNNVIRSHSANPDSFKSRGKQQRYRKDPSQRPKHNSAKQRNRQKMRTKSRESEEIETRKRNNQRRAKKIKRPRTPTAPKPKRKASPRRAASPTRHNAKRKRSKPEITRRQRVSPKKKANPLMYKAKSSEEVLLTQSTQNHASIASAAVSGSWSPQQKEVLPQHNEWQNTHYSFQKESALPALMQAKSIESPRDRVHHQQQQQQQHYDKHLGSPRSTQHYHSNGFGASVGTVPRRKNGILTNDEMNKKKTIMDRAKNMMSALPFSHSSGVNQLDVYAADNDVFVFDDDDDDEEEDNYEYSQRQRRKKQRKSTRSRTRDVGEMANKIRKEKKHRGGRRNKRKDTKSLNHLTTGGHHAHERSKSLEVNLEDLLKKRSSNNNEDDDDSLISDIDTFGQREFVFTSSSDEWSEDSDSASDDSKGSDSDEEDDETLSLWVGTWNVGESEFILDASIMRRWLGSNSSAMHRMHDIYVIGLQECVSQHRKQWINGLLAYLDNGRKQYLVIQKVHLMNILLIVIVNKLYMFRIRDIKCKTVACGKGNIIGNKGGVAIAMTFDETTFAFINVHLVARAERFVQRGENIERIFKNIDAASMGKFDKIDCLNQFHHVIFFGDLNYRIMKKFYDVCHLIGCKKYGDFVSFDQLHHQMETNEILYGFREGDISLFPPSYRWERDRNIISNKREQPPSYTDRILYKSLPECYSFWQTKYKSCMRCYGSDHRPIMSIFRFVPRNLPRHMHIKKKGKRGKKLKNVEITFYEIRAYIDTAKSRASNIEITDMICCNLYYKYANSHDDASPVHRIDGGIYDNRQHCWCWSLNVLDSLAISPYILDPEFLVTTHVHLQITNSSKSNSIIGYSVVPLFYVFPQSLVDRQKIKTKYNPLFLNDDDDGAAAADATTQNDRNNPLRKTRRRKLNDKEFNSPITIYGNYIGDIKGFIHAQSELVEKHRKITTRQKYK